MELPVGSYTFAFPISDGTNQWSQPDNENTYSGLTVATSGTASTNASVIRAPLTQTGPVTYDNG